jgi:hypothetical protein
MLLRSLTLLLLATSLSAAQAPSQAVGTFEGTVALAGTGAPVAGAFVRLYAEHPAVVIPEEGDYVVPDTSAYEALTATTNEAGRFTIPSVPLGKYEVATYSADLLLVGCHDTLVVSSGSGCGLPVTVDGIGPAHLNMKLEQSGTIEGFVKMADGKPAHTGGPVYEEFAINGLLRLSSGKLDRKGGAAHTDTKGHYVMRGLPTGDYTVFTALPFAWVNIAGGKEAGTGSLFVAPGIARSDMATFVHVTAGGPAAHLDITLPVSGLHTLSCKVITEDGSAPDHGYVSLSPSGDAAMTRTIPIDVGGTFQFDNLLPGKYTVTARFDPQQRFVSVSPDLKSMRMHISKPLYSAATTDIVLAEGDPAPITLTVKRNQLGL